MHRIPCLQISLLLTLCAAGMSAALAQTAAEPLPDLARADRLKVDAEQIRKVAEERYLDEEIACYERFLVNRCIDKARERRVVEIRRAREMDVEAGRIELAERNRRYAERKAEEAANAPAKALERSEQEARNRAESEARLKELAEKDAARIQREQEGKLRAQQETEARQRHDAAEAVRRKKEAADARLRAEKAIQDKADYEERAKKAAESKAEKDKKKQQ